jgi:hypothetical protein
VGAWGHEPLENDDAMDFMDDLSEEPKWALVQAAFLPALEDGYLEAPEASVAVAAAAVLAAARSDAEIGEEIAALLGVLGPAPKDLLPMALKALAKVGDGSELDELWSESDDYQPWRAALATLESELK